MTRCLINICRNFSQVNFYATANNFRSLHFLSVRNFHRWVSEKRIKVLIKVNYVSLLPVTLFYFHWVTPVARFVCWKGGRAEIFYVVCDGASGRSKKQINMNRMTCLWIMTLLHVMIRKFITKICVAASPFALSPFFHQTLNSWNLSK